ncbi:MAG: hypothetical protein HW389_1183 [Bacteroidetes bacterium]|nr:hypothetical protein [Bacteroidota bacterium]
MRRFFRTTYALAVIVLFLAVAVLGFTQTKVFHSYLRNRLIETVASETHAELTLGMLEGNLFTGFQAENVVLSRDGESVLTVKRLEAKYDPLGLLTKSLSVSRLTLHTPVICLTRSQTGSWNVERLLRSSSTDTSSSAWTINLKQLQIVNGELNLVDSLSLARRAADSSLQIWPGRIDYANLQLDSLNLDAGLTVRSRQAGLTLRSFACSLLRPQLRIKEFVGDFLLAPSTVSVRKLDLVTEKSHLRLDARLDSIDITRVADLAQLQFVPISARLDVERLDFSELKRFIGSSVRFLEREIACQIEVDGRFGLMDVRNVTLHAGSTALRIVGTLANLHNPRDLVLDLACIKNRVDPVDIRQLMPSLGIPDLSALGLVEYDLRFKGKPAAFNVRLASSSNVGSIDVDGNVDFRESPLSYDGTVKTSRFNLGLLVGDSSLASRLEATISVQGRGTRLAEMTCVARAEIDSSEFLGLPVSRSVAVVDVADRIIRPRISLHIGSSRVDLGGTLQVRPQDAVHCDISGRINSLNLADLTKKDQHNSDISFDLQARGDFKTPDALAGNFDLNFFRSSFDTVQFAGGPAAIRINTLSAEPHTLNVSSGVFDLDVQGRFTPSTVATALVRGAALVADAIRYRIVSLDSLRAEASNQQVVREFHSSVGPSHDSTSYTFTLNVNDSYPIGVVLGRKLEGSFSASGHVVAGDGGTQCDATANVQVLRYADKSISFAVEGGSLSFNADGLTPTRLLQSMRLSLGARAKRFDIAGLQTANLAVDLKMHGDSSSFDVGALLNSAATVKARGSGRYSNRLLSLNLDTLKAGFNSHVFQNSGTVALKVGRDGLQVSNMLMRREAEEISASGYFNPTGTSSVAVTAHNVLLNNIPKVVPRAASGESLPVVSGIANAQATFNGSFEEPRFSLDVNATGVRYEEETYGTVQIRASYTDRLLNIFAQLHSRPDSASAPPELLVSGTVPYDLSLSRGAYRKLEGEMNLDVQSSNFRLKFLDPLVPELNNLSGLMICTMKLRGTIESPSYEGSVVLQNARFLFNPLGIHYIVDGKLVPNGRNIVFENVTVRNIPEDQLDGKIDLSGNFSLEGLKIRDFDLAPHGQLLVMKESARRANQGLYGDLFVGTGPLGVTWKGSPSRSYVSGEVSVKYANLTLPPTRQTQDLPNSRIDVRVIDDTTVDNKPTKVQGGQTGTGPKSAIAPPRLASPLAADQGVVAPSSRSFLDNIVYHLAIETQGVTQLKFVFSDFTNEQLLAELNGRTAFTRDGDQVHLTGELKLGNRSYYNNFKKLDATGEIKFTGNPLNPELDVAASYEGVHRDASGVARLSGGAAKVVVKIFITGTRDQPKVKMGLAEYDQLGNLLPERPDMEGDAIAFLVTGSFRDELTRQDKLSLAGSSVLGGVASSVLSGPLTDLLRKEFGIVRSVDVLYYGAGSFQESADVRLTGEVGDAVFRLGGRVLSDLNNTNISIQLPMSALVGSEKWRNLLLEAERTVQGVESVDQRRESKGLRLLYRIIF